MLPAGALEAAAQHSHLNGDAGSQDPYRRSRWICDELGFVRLDPNQAQLLFMLLAHRYTRGGLAITSNLEFSDWTAVSNDDARLTAALLDRLTH
ncbi:MAG: ATP-binding protein, partial [Candidatus Dormiibacterota bacterium]